VETLFYILSFLQILLGLYLIWQVMQWLGYVRRLVHGSRILRAAGGRTLPCKGVEPGLERNLLALTEFESRITIFFHSRVKLDPARSIVEADSFEFEGERPRDHRGESEQRRREGEQFAGLP